MGVRATPPRWADRFLEWYCHPELLEEIQGDAYELFYRKAVQGKWKAQLSFAWNVIRFFRWKNIRKRKVNHEANVTASMISNIVKVSIRHFTRQPGHALINLTGLSVGFTCAFLILLWVLQEFSFDRFHADSDKLYTVLTHVKADGNIQTYDVASAALDVSSVPEVEKLVSVSTGSRWPHQLCFRPDGKVNECIYMSGVYANDNFFTVFNFPILQGDQNPLKAAANIAVSERMANALFGPVNPVGKTIKIDDRWEVTVASIFHDVPSNSSLQFDFVMPFSILKKQWGLNDQQFAENFFNTYLKTQTVVSADQLTMKLNEGGVVTEAFVKQGISYQAYPITDWHLKSKFEGGKQAGGRIEYIYLFVIIGIMVVIMAVINFVNLSTARATLRAKEIGIRKVTGAVRSNIAAQFMGESFLMVLAAFVLSALATQLVLPAFNLILAEPITLNVLTGWIPVYLIAFLVIVAVLAGIYPSLIMSSFQPVRIFKNKLGGAFGSSQFRKGLLTVQLCVSMGIVIFSGVLYRQLDYITHKDLGFDRGNTIRVEPTYQLLLKIASFKNELFKDPSIVSVGASASNPLTLQGGNTGVSWPGKPADQRVTFKTMGCSPEFPETMGLKIIEGRSFNSPSSDSAMTEALLTQYAVKVMGLKNPIGEEIKIGNVPCVVVGIVNDFHSESLHEAMLPVILYHVAYEHTSAIYVRYQPGKTKEAMDILLSTYKSFEPSFTMKYWFQDETFDELYKTENIAARLLLLFTIIAVIIAVVGMVGVATFNALRKTKEIGVRMVFGASTIQVLALLFGEFRNVLLTAIIIAGPAAWYASQYWLQGFAYRTVMPWWIFGIAFAGAAALIAAIIWILGMRTLSANPTQTLMSE